MKLKALHEKSGPAEADLERRPLPRVAVIQRIDPERPTRVWSLLLPADLHAPEQESGAPLRAAR